MRKWLLVLVAAMTMALCLSTAVQAESRATVTRATLPSFFIDDSGNFFPATCQVHQVINGNHRKESFRCSFDGDAPAPVVCDTSIGCGWSSDFDGAESISTHFLITPSGHMRGWATYY
jgi:hypothetical protein